MPALTVAQYLDQQKQVAPQQNNPTTPIVPATAASTGYVNRGPVIQTPGPGFHTDPITGKVIIDQTNFTGTEPRVNPPMTYQQAQQARALEEQRKLAAASAHQSSYGGQVNTVPALKQSYPFIPQQMEGKMPTYQQVREQQAAKNRR